MRKVQYGVCRVPRIHNVRHFGDQAWSELIEFAANPARWHRTDTSPYASKTSTWKEGVQSICGLLGGRTLFRPA